MAYLAQCSILLITVFQVSLCAFSGTFFNQLLNRADTPVKSVLKEAPEYVERMKIGPQNGWQILKRHESKIPEFCHNLDCPVYKPAKGGKGYEAREYVKTDWFSTSLSGADLDGTSRKMFMSLFDYIDGDNSKGEKIAMTAPVLIKVTPGPGPTCGNDFTMSFFQSPKEPNPPMPKNKDITFTSLDKETVFVKYFSGFANDKKWLAAALELAEDLKRDGRKFKNDTFYTAGYDSPFRLLNRHNEVWFVSEE